MWEPNGRHDMYTLWFRSCWRLQTTRGEDIAISNIKSTMYALKTRWDNTSRDAHGSVWSKGGIQRRGWDHRGGFFYGAVRLEPNLQVCQVFRNHGISVNTTKAYLGPPLYTCLVIEDSQSEHMLLLTERVGPEANACKLIIYVCVYICMYVRQQNKYAYSSVVWMLCKRIIHF